MPGEPQYALKPCPCCASISSASDNTIIGGWFVACANAKCSVKTGTFPTKPMAVRAWNTRAPVPHLSEGSREAREKEITRLATIEECASIAENYDHRSDWSADEDMNAQGYFAAGETCDEIAKAIRALLPAHGASPGSRDNG